MRQYILFAILAGAAWGVGGYFEKAGLHQLRMPAIAGIALRTAVALVILGIFSVPAWKSVGHPGDARGWILIVVGGGVIAGSLGMWCFYSSLATTENLGVTLAIAFALSPVAGVLTGLARGEGRLDLKTGIGLVAIVTGIVLVQLGRRPGR
ncbi:MAG: DMT family transporter [Candidatus Krumholzibacteriota bacterium]|nr:DMT family transporter [Candidatus Krumholzibacteriota bacterium]